MCFLCQKRSYNSMFWGLIFCIIAEKKPRKNTHRKRPPIISYYCVSWGVSVMIGQTLSTSITFILY